MKKFIIIAVAVLALCAGTKTAHASWLHDDTEKERRIQVEQQLVKQQQATGSWRSVAFVLGIACVITLIGGTIIGSRARNHANTTK